MLDARADEPVHGLVGDLLVRIGGGFVPIATSGVAPAGEPGTFPSANL